MEKENFLKTMNELITTMMVNNPRKSYTTVIESSLFQNSYGIQADLVLKVYIGYSTGISYECG